MFAYGSGHASRKAIERRRAQQTQVEWDAQWEQEAAYLESVLSASSSGVEDVDGERRRRPTVQKRIMTRKFAKSILDAKRSGELHAIAEEWEKAHSELASKASDLNALNEKAHSELASKASDLNA